METDIEMEMAAVGIELEIVIVMVMAMVMAMAMAMAMAMRIMHLGHSKCRRRSDLSKAVFKADNLGPYIQRSSRGKSSCSRKAKRHNEAKLTPFR